MVICITSTEFVFMFSEGRGGRKVNTYLWKRNHAGNPKLTELVNLVEKGSTSQSRLFGIHVG